MKRLSFLWSLISLSIFGFLIENIGLLSWQREYMYFGLLTFFVFFVCLRLRDIGISSWFSIFVFVPFVNFLFLIFLLLKSGNSDTIANKKFKIFYFLSNENKKIMKKIDFFYKKKEEIEIEKIENLDIEEREKFFKKGELKTKINIDKIKTNKEIDDLLKRAIDVTLYKFEKIKDVNIEKMDLLEEYKVEILEISKIYKIDNDIICFLIEGIEYKKIKNEEDNIEVKKINIEETTRKINQKLDELGE